MNPQQTTKHYLLADLALLLGLIALVAWYLFDAYSASTHIMNLMLIGPLAMLTLALCTLEFLHQLKKPTPPKEQLESALVVIPVIALFAVYVLTLEWLGLDGGTFLFVASFLILRGERRWVWLFGYSLVFSSFVALFFSSMLPYPMPMLILPTAY